MVLVIDPIERFVAGLTREEAVKLVRECSNKGPHRLFLTDTWYPPRAERLVHLLPPKLSAEEATVLRAWVENAVGHTALFEWLERRHELADPAWANYLDLARQHETPWDIEMRKREFFPWEDVEACRGREPSREALARLDAARGNALPCPVCRASADSMSWVYFVSPDWTWKELCGRAGWLAICEPCHIQADYTTHIMN